MVDERAGNQYGEDGEDPVYIDLFYLFDLSDTLRLSASVENLFDRDPPKHQIEYGYDARLGSSLGRTFEIGLKKVFWTLRMARNTGTGGLGPPVFV